MRITKLDYWCMINGIKSPTFFVNDIKMMAERDELFIPIANKLKTLDNELMDIEPDIDDKDDFTNKLAMCYGVGMCPSIEQIYYAIYKDKDALEKIIWDYYKIRDEVFNYYKTNYNEFLDIMNLMSTEGSLYMDIEWEIKNRLRKIAEGDNREMQKEFKFDMTGVDL